MLPEVSVFCNLILAVVSINIVFLTATQMQEEQEDDLGLVHHRERRDVIYPIPLVYPNGTVFQINIAVQAPIAVPNKTVSISLGVQLNFVLPTDASEFHKTPVMRPKRDSSMKLQRMYLPFEAYLEEHGFDGKSCILRSICEAAYSPFNHKEKELLDEIAHVILTPSEEIFPTEFDCKKNVRIMDNNINMENSYLAAECLGKYGGNCSLIYEDCPESPLDLISQKTEIHEPFVL